MARNSKRNPRVRTIGARCTVEFEQEIRAKAESLGLTVSDFILGLLGAALEGRLAPKTIEE